MRRFIFIFFLIVGCVFPKVVFADTLPQDYVVSGSEKFTGSTYPHLLSSLIVPAGTSLKIEAGVKLTFTAGALFLINGTLTIAGTEKNPAVLQAQSGSIWNGVYATSPQVSFSWLTITSAQNALIATKGGTKFEHLLLEDNIQNTLVLGQVGYTHFFSYDLNNITFQNRLLGTAMGNEGVILQGNSPVVNFHDSLFKDTRISVPHGVLGLLIEGERIDMKQNNILHTRGCKFGQKTSTSASTLQLEFNSDSCNAQIIPVVFVPGYGTSINLSQLTQGKPASPELAGWRFFQGVTPAYTAFLQDLGQNNIPTTVAYYDWRQPVQTIVTQYLLPAIAAAKAQTGSNVVNLVAHSFGGLVARQYIQSDNYQGDVVNLMEIGTPNLGSAKVYRIWEAGVLPPDWQNVMALVRWYQYQQGDENLSTQAVIQKYFPSVQQLLPIYPAIIRLGVQLSASDLFYQNTLAESLLATQSSLLQRVAVKTVASQTESTLTSINVGPLQRSLLWRDGLPLDQQPALTANGDGTVPLQSATINGVQNILTTGGHAELPKSASREVIQALYPFQQYIPVPTPNPLTRNSSDMLWFFFDCPVTVQITLPDGTSRSSTSLDSDSEIGNVAVSPEMIWMVLPSEPGDYTVNITALQDTTVRAWVDMADPLSFTLTANQTQIWHPFAIAVPEDSGPSPSALPSLLPSVSPQPSPIVLADTSIFAHFFKLSVPHVLFVPMSGVIIVPQAFPSPSWYIHPWKKFSEHHSYHWLFLPIFGGLTLLLFLHWRRRARKRYPGAQH